MRIKLEELKELPPPYEILELEPCTPVYLKPVDWELGKITITPRWPGAPPSKVVECVRIHVDPKTKKYFPYYWDITPRRLVHQLAPMLAQGIPEGMWLKIHRDIPGPKAHFEVAWVEKPE